MTRSSPRLAVVKTDHVLSDYDGTLELAHLLALLRDAADLLEEILRDVDANILRAHAGQLAAGREWPGLRITSTLADWAETPRMWLDVTNDPSL